MKEYIWEERIQIGHKNQIALLKWYLDRVKTIKCMHENMNPAECFFFFSSNFIIIFRIISIFPPIVDHDW